MSVTLLCSKARACACTQNRARGGIGGSTYILQLLRACQHAAGQRKNATRLLRRAVVTHGYAMSYAHLPNHPESRALRMCPCAPA